MNILMVMQHVNFFRNLDSVTRELDRRGHKVTMLHGTRLDDAKAKKNLSRKKDKLARLGRGLNAAQTEFPSVRVGYRPEPSEPGYDKVRIGRALLNRSLYLRKGHPSPERVVDALEKELPDDLQRLSQHPIARWLLAQRWPLAAWRVYEAMRAPSPNVTEVIREANPDVVLVSPTIWPKKPVEADYIRAARSLGIPTIGYVNSWDNLTSKGTVHLLPDALIVWNEALAGEAVELHDVPRRIIRITGAPHLDPFFEMSPINTQEEMCARMGCPPDRPYMVYLCTSRSLMADETSVVTRMAEALARQMPDKAPTLVVRPHPTNSSTWEGYAHPGVVVYPQVGDLADTQESWREYYDQLSGASCVFGLNTTAFLEATVAGRPCLTIVSDEFYGAQGRTGHFRHLLYADFMEVCSGVEEVAVRVEKILAGEDEKAEGRNFFIRWFLRPRGVDRPATLEVVDVIERMARTSAKRSSPDMAADLQLSPQGQTS